MNTVLEKFSFFKWFYNRSIRIREWFRDIKDRVEHEPSIRLMATLAMIVVVLGVVVWIVETLGAVEISTDDTSLIDSFGRAMYWMFISGTTTGYGDIIPHTSFGRGLTVLIILFSMILTSVLTATIASWFVEKRLLEGKGMEKVTWRNHIVICGWNSHSMSVLEGIYRETRDGMQVALVNDLPEDEISELLYRFKRQGLRFVRGDFVHENILERANVTQASTVVILAGGSLRDGYARADERTALCALAVKSMNPDVKVCAELVNEENVSHLKRAQVDHIMVLGEHNDFLLTNSITAPGVTLAVQELLNPERGFLIQQRKIPAQLVGQEFAELLKYFREKQRALVIGVVSEEKKGMSLDDILSEDMSAIDLFIKRQFEGVEDDYFFKGRSMDVRINPPDNYKVQKNDLALLIAEPGETKAMGAGG